MFEILNHLSPSVTSYVTGVKLYNDFSRLHGKLRGGKCASIFPSLSSVWLGVLRFGGTQITATVGHITSINDNTPCWSRYVVSGLTHT